MASEQGKAAMIGSVEKALLILDVFAQARKPLGVTDVSRSLDYNFSTTHHLVSTLAAMSYLEQDPETKKYHLGIKCLEIGLAAEESYKLIDRARPILQELASRVNENVNLAVFDRMEAVYVEQASSSRTIAMFARLGARVPLHCTGVGKVYLASLEPHEARALLDSQGWHRFTGNTLTEWYLMERELLTVRQAGYAIDHEEREEGVACIAAPIKDALGQVIAAVSVSGPSGRVLSRISDLVPEVVRSAKDISTGIGHLLSRHS